MFQNSVESIDDKVEELQGSRTKWMKNCRKKVKKM